MPGIFVVFEGIDGVGKSTQVRLLAKRLEALGRRVVCSKEPTDGPHGARLRASAATGRLPLAEELELFVLDRTEHVERVIAPALARGDVVILDRYFYSTIAYQGARGGDPEAIRERMQVFPRPHAVYILNLAPAAGHARIGARGDAPNAFERRDALAKARAIFRALDGPEIVHVSAVPPADDVHEHVYEHFAATFLQAAPERENGGPGTHPHVR